jgi:hypothetical protein
MNNVNIGVDWFFSSAAKAAGLVSTKIFSKPERRSKKNFNIYKNRQEERD